MRRTNAKTARKTTARSKPAPVKAAPVKQAAGRDVTQYADKEPTELHKTMARWIVTEVGYDPNEAGSKREAFLMGVSIATVAKPAFQASDYLAAWYEESGTSKRGRGAAPTTGPAKGRKVKDEEPEEEEDYDESEEDDEEEEEEEDLDDEDLAALEEELNGLAIGALRKAAKDEYGVSGAGSKQEIINRILDAVEAEEADDEEGDEEESDEPADLDELAEELNGLSAADLKAAAKEYGVTPKRGESKATLVERILDAVVKADEEEEEEEAPPVKGRGKATTTTKGSTKSKEFLF